jgi:hypothetical protein
MEFGTQNDAEKLRTTNKNEVNKIATYIVNQCKSVSKSKEYAISIVAWYSLSCEQDALVEEEIKKIW